MPKDLGKRGKSAIVGPDLKEGNHLSPDGAKVGKASKSGADIISVQATSKEEAGGHKNG